MAKPIPAILTASLEGVSFEAVAADSDNLPAATYSTVGFQLHVLTLGERASKGWVFEEEQLGEGWKGMQGGIANLGHDHTNVLGYIPLVFRRGNDILANTQVSRKKLEAEGIDPLRVPTEMSCSVEFHYRADTTTVVKGDKTYDLTGAASEGLVEFRETAGKTELVVIDQDAKMLPGNPIFDDVAFVPLNLARPSFASARVLMAAAADDKALEFKDSIEYVTQALDRALNAKYAHKTPEGYTNYPYVMATFQGTVVFSVYADGKDGYWRATYTINENGEAELGDATEVKLEKTFVAAAMEKRTDGGPRFSAPEGLASLALLDVIYGDGIAPKAREGGHKKPPAGYPTSRGQYADGANYKFPLDTKKHAASAVSRFHFAVAGGELDYSRAELVSMAKKIVRAARKFGIKVDHTVDVGKYAGLKASSAGAAASIIGKEVNQSMAEETYTKDSVAALVKEAHEAGKAAAAEELLGDEAFTSKVIEDWKGKELPALLQTERTKVREALVAQATALDQLNAVKPLTEEEKAAFIKAMEEAQGFDLVKEVALRKVSVLEIKPDPAAAAADSTDAKLKAAAAVWNDPNKIGLASEGSDAAKPEDEEIAIF